MFIPRYILAPLVGGIIGYITNDIAIKMLFHPRKSIYIGSFHIPFTPGLIPQQKKRIAASIGRVVSRQLLNTETLKSAVLSQNAVDKLRDSISREITKMSTDTRTVRDLLEQRFSQEQIETTEDRLCDEAADLIMEKLIEAHIGAVISDAILEDIQKMIPDSGGFSAMITEMISKSMGSVVEKVVEEKIRDKGPALIRKNTFDTAEKLLNMQLCEIYQIYRENIPQIVETIVSIYREAMDVNLDKVLSAVNIEAVIVEKVASFDSAQLEDMIFGILNKELKAIVYLGAALGFLMGFINLMF